VTSIEHTAYPRLKRTLTSKELDQIYTPTPAELFLAHRTLQSFHSLWRVGRSFILDIFEQDDKEPKPDILHGDTQAQSSTIFGLAYLLGIALMPRIKCHEQK